MQTFADSLSAYFSTAGMRTTVVRMIERQSLGLGVQTVSSAQSAATALATSDVVIVDHEFSGPADVDRAVFDAIERLRCPLIVRLRAVARVPTRYQREMFDQIYRFADAVVVSSATTRRRLAAVHSGTRGMVVLISDGARPLARVFDELAGATAPTMVTSGPVAPDCGLEMVIDAMAALRSLDPRPRYLIIGPTEPAVLAREGEAYRHGLMARTIDRGVAPMVQISAKPLDALDAAQADVVVVASACREQLESRVVVEALAAGTPVVAIVNSTTSGLAAAAGIDRLVPSGDPAALARILRSLLTDPLFVATVAQRNIGGGEPAWPEIANQYQALAAELIAARRSLGVKSGVNLCERRT